MTAAVDQVDWRVTPIGYGTHLSDGQWWSAPHLEVIAAAVVETVLTGGRLIVTLPPRHGKSELIDVWTPVWFLDLFPERRVILSTYNDTFAAEWGEKVRDHIKANPDRLQVRLKGDTTAKNRWRTNKGGTFYAVGVGSGITGRGGDLVIVDDPHKDWAEANSEVYRNRIWNWWLSTLYTRLEPGAAVVVCLTRWHENDFVGRLLESDTADDWRVINLPALAEGGDVLGRAEGEALWPERYDRERLLHTQKTLGPYVFGGMYQQHPSAPEGQILKRASWRWYVTLPPGIEQWLGSWDMNFGEGAEPDYVVGQVWARKGANCYLAWETRGRWDFTETRKQVRRLASDWPQVTNWIVEAKANGPAIISDLRNEVAGLNGYSPKDSKVARAYAVAPILDAGNVFLQQDVTWDPMVPGTLPTTPADLIDECAAFDSGLFDDQVDCTTQALLHLLGGSAILKDATVRDQRGAGRR